MLLIYIIIALSVVLHLFRYYSDKPVIIVKASLFTALCIMEIYYLFTADDCQWFLDYNLIGIWKMLGGFIILAVIVLNQYGVFRILLEELVPEESGVNYQIGLYSYILAVIAVIFCALFLDVKMYSPYIVYFLIAAQVIQILLIFYQCRPNWKVASACAFIYILGTFSFIIILYHYAGPFAIAIFLMIALKIVVSVAKTRLNQREY